MIHEEPLPFKTVFAWCFIILCGLIAAYLAFLSLISVWVGVTHIYRAGSWVPILVGIILLCVVLWLLLPTLSNHTQPQQPERRGYNRILNHLMHKKTSGTPRPLVTG